MNHATAKNRFTLWFIAIRPKTLLAALSPVLVGGAYAWAQGLCNLPVWILTAATAMLLQAIANMANDFFDYKHGFDLPGRQGPLRIMQNGLIKPQTFVWVIAIFALIAVLLGAALVWHGGWPIFIIGIISLAFAFLYSAGPWPLASHAMGEVAAVLFFGPVAGGGAYYLQTGTISATALVLSLSPGLLNACIMMVNNYRDMPIDLQTGKTTLANIVGAACFRRIYALSVVLAYTIVILTILLEKIPPTALFTLLSLPLAVKIVRDIYVKTGTVLNVTLAQTALLNFALSLLLSIGMLL